MSTSRAERPRPKRGQAPWSESAGSGRLSWATPLTPACLWNFIQATYFFQNSSMSTHPNRKTDCPEPAATFFQMCSRRTRNASASSV